jgi:hypothetical protein
MEIGLKMEDNLLGDKSAIYLCNKEEKNGIYTLKLFANNSILVRGKGLESCKEEIYSKIIYWNGDAEAVLEFIPPLAKNFDTGIYFYTSLGWNEMVKLENTEDLFEGGVCPKCKFGIGKRNNYLLNITREPTDYIVAVSARRRRDNNDFPRIYPLLQIYSKKFIEQLTKKEKNNFDIREVYYKGVTSNYVELIPKKVISHIGHKGAIYPHVFTQSWRCSKCNRMDFLTQIDDYSEKFIFIEMDKIPKNTSLIFVEYHSGKVALTLENNRWIEILNNIKGKHISTKPILALYKEYIEYPKLEEPEEFEW